MCSGYHIGAVSAPTLYGRSFENPSAERSRERPRRRWWPPRLAASMYLVEFYGIEAANGRSLEVTNKGGSLILHAHRSAVRARSLSTVSPAVAATAPPQNRRPELAHTYIP
jgi:hypothetical protein